MRRSQLLELLPKNSVGAEIGVWTRERILEEWKSLFL